MNSEKNILLGLMGDVMLGRLVDQHLKKAPPESVWGDLLPILKTTDLNLLNLECALTTSNQRIDKVFNFKANPSRVQVLLEGNIHVVNLANNHILDFDVEGLEETLSTLDQASIFHVGAGKNLHEAKKPLILTRKGLKIAIIGGSDNEPSWAASEQKPGIHYLDPELPIDLSFLRPLADFILLTLHWGPNMRQRPSSTFRHFAHHAVEHGLDLLHGHSAHIFQGVERYKNSLILYDTGDFIDDYAIDPALRNDYSFFFLVEINKTGCVALHLLPVIISNFCIRRATGKAFDIIATHMQNLSDEFSTELMRIEDGVIPYPHLMMRVASTI